MWDGVTGNPRSVSERSTASARWRRIALIGLTLLALPALAVEKPAGYGKARFGASIAEVKKLYPKMEDLGDTALGAAVVKGPYIKRFVLHKESLPGLAKPSDVELRFWKDKLWVVIVYFGENDAASVIKAITDQYGPPTLAGSESPVWRSEESTIVVAGKQKWYSINDNELSKEAQAAFMEDLKSTMQQRTAALTPGAGKSATPAGESKTGEARGGKPAEGKPVAPRK